jgi:hypothetical protein
MTSSNVQSANGRIAFRLSNDAGSRFRVHHRVADRYRAGRVLLAGNTAHVHSPAGGQGMNAGILDAVRLADALIAAHAGDTAALGVAVVGVGLSLNARHSGESRGSREAPCRIRKGRRLATARRHGPWPDWRP